jgi:ribosome maturation factor RimP
MAKKRVASLVQEALEGFLAENGYELYNVEFVKEGRDWFLRVFVDRAADAASGGEAPCAEAAGGGPPAAAIGTDDCEKVSRFLSGRLDELDPIEHNYYLEVSSPGMDRELLKEKDFTRYAGRRVALSLYKPFEGSKTVRGVLRGLEGGAIALVDGEGRAISLPREMVSKARLDVMP